MRGYILLITIAATFSSLVTALLCDVSKYGAVGDGVKDNTALLQSLIDTNQDCQEGLYFPEGNTFISGALFLRSDITITIEGTLFASPDYTNHEKWPLIYTRYAGYMRMMTASLINGGRCLKMKDDWNSLPPYIHGDQCAEWDKLKNVAINGSGTINGNGADSGFNPDNNKVYGGLRPTLLGLTWITGLTITDLSIVNPTFWTVHILFCVDVLAARLRIDSMSPKPIHNGDGIDPDSSSNVVIEGCHINTNDDNVAVKSGMDEDGRKVGIPSKHIVVRDCEFGHGHGGASIGTDMSGGVSDVLFDNIRCNGTDNGVKIKSMRDRGSYIEDVVVQNMAVSNVGEAIVIIQHYHDSFAIGPAPHFRNITLRNITAEDGVVHVGQIDCLRQPGTCEGLHFVDIDVVRAANQTWGPCGGVSSGSQLNVLPAIPCVISTFV
jgi:polygalacturonase